MLCWHGFRFVKNRCSNLSSWGNRHPRTFRIATSVVVTSFISATLGLVVANLSSNISARARLSLTEIKVFARWIRTKTPTRMKENQLFYGRIKVGTDYESVCFWSYPITFVGEFLLLYVQWWSWRDLNPSSRRLSGTTRYK